MKKRESSPYAYIELFKYPSVQAATYIMMICCFNFNNMYKGMILLSEAMKQSPRASIIFTISDFLSCIVASIFLTKFGRAAIVRNTVMITCSLAILISFLSFSDQAMLILLGINRFASLLTLSAGYLYSVEAFPTRVRGTGVGFCSVFSNIGKIFAILTMYAGNKYSFIFGVLGLVCYIVLRLVPGIKDMYEDNLLDEVEEISEKMKSNKYI